MSDEDRIFVPAHAADASVPDQGEGHPATHDIGMPPVSSDDASFVPAHAAPARSDGEDALFSMPLGGEGAHPFDGDRDEASQDVPAQASAAPAAASEPTADVRAEDSAGEEDSPETTAEIDVDAVEARLGDLGSTQSFEAIPEERINTDSTYDAGTTTTLMWGARSDSGCVRSHNEDSYLVQSPLFCVCDGMGGHAAGEVASAIAVETIAKLAPHTADASQLAASVEAANTAIIEAAATGLGKPGMGCTATAAYIEGNVLAIAHVGDSRAYLVHEGTLIRVTRDHSYVEELVDAGEITADEARVHPNRSVITRALGSDPAMYADHFQLNIEEGDRLILCSDGLSSMIPDSEIENICNQSDTAQICTDNLVDAALAAGGSDNVTVVVVDIVDDGRVREVARRRKRNAIIAAAAVVVAIAIAAIACFVSITGSVFLGVHNGCVAIYSGIPDTFMGMELYSLADDTTIEIDDLPSDTQNRLQAGIPQASMDEARETIVQYREQIDAEQLRQVQTAEAVRSGAKDKEAADGAADDAQTLADTVAPTEGGD